MANKLQDSLRLDVFEDLELTPHEMTLVTRVFTDMGNLYSACGGNKNNETAVELLINNLNHAVRSTVKLARMNTHV